MVRKLAMAITGLVLVGFVLVHAAANLQIFAGPDRIDGYARGLRAAPVLLWTVRAGLATAFLIHVWLGVGLARDNRVARPVRYHRRPSAPLDRAGRTMLWSGLFVGLFVLLHLSNLTWGTLHPRFVHLQVYRNVTTLLRMPAWGCFYLAALVALAAHMVHGTRSLFRSTGLAAAPNRGRVAHLSVVVTALAVTGLGAVVLGVMTGFLR
ncbi:MAG TPA: succinate dehydrogenase cytochrome b subunit [Polyangia bacterium]|nr:succinate dehydrogenase cytochrome b subunit [Polyangia bacterium]